MTLEASPHNSRGFEHSENLRIVRIKKISTLKGSPSIMLGHSFRVQLFMYHHIPQVLRTRGYYKGDAFSIIYLKSLPIGVTELNGILSPLTGL